MNVSHNARDGWRSFEYAKQIASVHLEGNTGRHNRNVTLAHAIHGDQGRRPVIIKQPRSRIAMAETSIRFAESYTQYTKDFTYTPQLDGEFTDLLFKEFDQTSKLYGKSKQGYQPPKGYGMVYFPNEHGGDIASVWEYVEGVSAKDLMNAKYKQRHTDYTAVARVIFMFAIKDVIATRASNLTNVDPAIRDIIVTYDGSGRRIDHEGLVPLNHSLGSIQVFDGALESAPEFINEGPATTATHLYAISKGMEGHVKKEFLRSKDSKNFNDLIKRATTEEPLSRIDPDKALDHPFFSSAPADEREIVAKLSRSYNG